MSAGCLYAGAPGGGAPTIAPPSGFTLPDDVNLIFGSSSDVLIQWDTAETNDSLKMGLPTATNARWLITDTADMGVDSGLAAVSFPTLTLHSGNAADFTERLELSNQGAASVITTPKVLNIIAQGGVITQFAAGGVTINQGGGTPGVVIGTIVASGVLELRSTSSVTLGAVVTNDDVAIGALVMSGGGEKLRVVGAARVEGKLTVTGSIDPTDIDISTTLTTSPASGGLLAVRYSGATTLTGALTGALIDARTDVTAGANTVIGVDVRMPATSGSSSRGLDVSSAQTTGVWIEATASGSVTLASFLTGMSLDARNGITAGVNIIRTLDIQTGNSSNASTRAIRSQTVQTAGIWVEAFASVATTLTGAVDALNVDLSNYTAGANQVRGIVLRTADSSDANSRILELSSEQTAGTWVELSAAAALTLSAGLTGISIDANTNVTPGVNAVFALDINVPAGETGILLRNDSQLRFGSGSEIKMSWDTGETNDVLKLGLDDTNIRWLIGPDGRITGVDTALAAATETTLSIQGDAAVFTRRLDLEVNSMGLVRLDAPESGASFRLQVDGGTDGTVQLSGSQWQVPTGSAASPGLTFFGNTSHGLFLSGGFPRIAQDGAERVRIVAEGILVEDANGAGTPSYAFLTDPDTGMFRAAANTLAFSIGGNEGARLAEPADGDTALLIRRNVSATITLQQVSMGAADSGGTGFKLLRVPN